MKEIILLIGFLCVFVIGIMVGSSSSYLKENFNNPPVIETPSTYTGYNEYTKHNFTAIAVKKPVIIIPMDRSNKDKLDLICHETCHQLVWDNHTHFCGE